MLSNPYFGGKSCKVPYTEEIKWTWVKPSVGPKKIMQWVLSKKTHQIIQHLLADWSAREAQNQGMLPAYNLWQ